MSPFLTTLVLSNGIYFNKLIAVTTIYIDCVLIWLSNVFSILELRRGVLLKHLCLKSVYVL